MTLAAMSEQNLGGGGGALGYDDDLTSLYPSLRGLQKAADICNDCSQE